jgi:hypothetical protein
LRDDAAAVEVREDAARAGTPRRLARARVHEAVAAPVAGDHAEAGRGAVGDEGVDARAGPAREANTPPRERPALGAVRLEGDELVLARRDDEQAMRRPGSVEVVAEPPLRAVAVHDPDAAVR